MAPLMHISTTSNPSINHNLISQIHMNSPSSSASNYNTKVSNTEQPSQKPIVNNVTKTHNTVVQ